MKLLQNKSTGKIGCLVCSFGKTPEKITVVEYIDGKRGSSVWYYNSLAELNAGWEDYEKPKDHWFMDCCGDVYKVYFDGGCVDTQRKQIGNYFETKEEAEKAVEKLKAWKRLKDKGFQFESWWGGSKDISFWLDTEIDEDIAKDLDLLFGGKE